MTQIEKPKGKAPYFKGDGVAVWINKDKNGKQYLSVKILSAFSVNCFSQENTDNKNTPEQENAPLEIKRI